MEINFKPSVKQSLIFDLFNDDITTEVVYGGSLSSGKSYLLAALLIMKSLQCPGIRIGLARGTLTNLKKTTVISIMECLDNWGLLPNVHYNYNSTSGLIQFRNGSEIVLVELTNIPSDPQFTRLGGLLLTMGAIDEVTEIDERAKQIFQSRLGRWKNNELKLKPFLIMTCNPSKSSFIYRDYYRPFKDGKLKPYQKFVQALPSDNPYLPAGYIENLEQTMTFSERKRLLQGEWDLENDPRGLFKSEDVYLMYDKSIVFDTDKTMRLSCDVAFTSDKCVLIVWEGLTIKKIISGQRAEDDTLIKLITDVATEWKVKPYNICWDADGVGKFLMQHFPSGKEIHNNGKTLQNHGYRNLKSELFFKLADLVKLCNVKIDDLSFKKEIEEELSVIKHKPKDTMDKIELISKADMKRELGRSPDYADAMAYGMVFHLKPNTMVADDFVFVNF